MRRGAERVVRFVAGLTVVPAAIVALGAVFQVMESVGDLFGDPRDTPTTGLEGSPLRLLGSRGDEAKLAIVDNSVNGHWASETGLRLTLGNGSGFQRTFPLVPPQEKDWDEDLFPARRSDHEFDIPGEFTIPDVPGPEAQTLTGDLSGDFLYPRGTEDNDPPFIEVRLDLSLPVTLEVVSAAESERIRSEARSESLGRLPLAVVAAVGSFAYVISYGMWKDGEQKRRWEPVLTVLLGAGVWAMFALLYLLEPFGE